MKLKDLILIALLCANITLAAVVVTVYVAKAEPQAMAATATHAGDYVMVTGGVTGNHEGVLIIDVVAKQANLYIPKIAAGQGGVAWTLTSSRSLTADFGAGGR